MHAIKIKHIIFRRNFIEEYVKLFNNVCINTKQEFKVNNVPISIEVSASTIGKKIKKYIKKLQLNFLIDY